MADQMVKVKDAQGRWLSITSNGQLNWVNNIVQGSLLASKDLEKYILSDITIIPVTVNRGPDFTLIRKS